MECKLSGNFIQQLDITLFPGEEFFAQKGALICLEAGLRKEVGLNGSGLKRILKAKLSGESLFVIRLYNDCGVPRKAVIGSSCGLLPVKIESETLLCHSGVFVASDSRMEISSKISFRGFMGGMGLFLQKISGNGTVYLDTKDEPLVLDLRPGERVELDENHIIALRGIDESRMSANVSADNFFGGEGFSMLCVTGPGRVYLSPGSLLTTEE